MKFNFMCNYSVTVHLQTTSRIFLKRRDSQTYKMSICLGQDLYYK